MVDDLVQSQNACGSPRHLRFHFKLARVVAGQSVARRTRRVVQLKYLVTNTKIRTIMSTKENNSEVAVDKVGDEKDAKSDLKATKRAAEEKATEAKKARKEENGGGGDEEPHSDEEDLEGEGEGDDDDDEDVEGEEGEEDEEVEGEGEDDDLEDEEVEEELLGEEEEEDA